MRIPDRSYFKKIEKILYGKDLNIKNKKYEFNAIRRKIYSNKDILELMGKNGVKISEISSGVSDRKAYCGYIEQAVNDLKSDKYYKNYYSSAGNPEARLALSIFESYKLSRNKYSPDDFCLTEGSTGAITMIFEYFKKNYPKREILIQSPNYYLYKFASNYYGLKLKELMPEINKKNPSFISIDIMIKNITDKTKLIIITNPANPSGETFDKRDLERLFLIAKKKNILILVDELFSELMFQPKKYVFSDAVAAKIGALNNLVVIKGFSKSKNLVGFRIGYLFSKNRKLIESIIYISQQRSSFSVASNFTGMITLDAFIQSVRYKKIYKNLKDYRPMIKEIYRDFYEVTSIRERVVEDLTKEFERYQRYFNSLMNYYSQRFDDSMKILSKDMEFNFPKISAFNTIVKIKDLNKINSFDFMLNCFLIAGLKTEIGPCFGFDQKIWDDKFGYWLRLTFAKDKKLFKEGITRFIEFKSVYLQQPDLFLKTELFF
ncbi:MAG: pyridoxal phosphate-dependent aminotransferase [Candidatus Roizmanbacteria bacterium]|nr:pyridoxal phosphate-dependent aminotransferase [Candidatus Roizmanbacteria bacterium]